jgi:MFS family permease
MMPSEIVGRGMTAATGISAATERSTTAHVVWASALGTAIEWYDFLIYGTAAALVLNKLFFPSFDPFVGTLAAFSTYAVGFVARPIGGAIIGHYGDRLGRKKMLVATMIAMGLGTFLIGCLPTYSQIGVWAPIFLVILRFIQGIGLGGEWSGAVVMVVEHSGNRRGFYGSLVQIGFPVGVAASTGIFGLMTQLPETDFLSWGWRVPFLISILLVGVGFIVRLKLAETPHFKEVPELFRTQVRYSGASLGANVAAALSGGFSPLIATALLAWAGSYWPVSVYIIALSIITIIATLMAPETARDTLRS